MRCATSTLAVSLVVVFGLVGGAWGATWDNDAGDNDWLNPVNWDGDALPVTGEDTYIGMDDPDATVVSGPGAVAGELNVGRGTVGQTTGKLVILPGADLQASDQFSIGAHYDGVVEMSGGNMRAGSQAFLGDGPVSGQLTISDGKMSVLSLYVGLDVGSTGHVQLDGGELEIRSAGSLYVGGYAGQSGAEGAGSIDLAGGILTTEGDATGWHYFTGPIAQGLITAYGGIGTVYSSYDDSTEDGLTTFWGVIPEPSSIALVMLGLVGLTLGWRRRRA